MFCLFKSIKISQSYGRVIGKNEAYAIREYVVHDDLLLGESFACRSVFNSGALFPPFSNILLSAVLCNSSHSYAEFFTDFKVLVKPLNPYSKGAPENCLKNCCAGKKKYFNVLFCSHTGSFLYAKTINWTLNLRTPSTLHVKQKFSNYNYIATLNSHSVFTYID